MWRGKGSMNVLLSDKQFDILRLLDKVGFMSGIVREADITYSHITKITSLFADKGLVVINEPSGKIRKVVLTAKGKKLLDLYFEIKGLLK